MIFHILFSATFNLFILHNFVTSPNLIDLKSNDRDDIDKNILENVNESRIESYLREFSKKVHVAGTERQKDSAYAIHDEWLKLKLDSVKTQTYHVMLTYPDEKKYNKVSLIDTMGNVKWESSGMEDYLSPDNNDTKLVSPFNAYSADGNITSDLVYVNYGRYDDFLSLKNGLNLSLSGKIGIARYGSIFRGTKVKNSEIFKLAGLILYSDPTNCAAEGTDTKEVYPNSWWMPESGVQRGSLSLINGDPMTMGYPSIPSMYREMPSKGDLPSIPVYPISYSDAWHLLSSMGGSTVPKAWQGSINTTYRTGPGFIDYKSDWKVKLEVNFKREKRPIYNVIGRLNGDIEPDRYIILGNHRDAWTYGGSDPISGTACLLEVTRVFALLRQGGWKPRRTIIFASWDAEEYGLIGSTEYVEENLKVLKQRAVAYLNVDICVTGNYSLKINSSPLLSKIAYEVAKMIPNPNKTEIDLGRKMIYDTWLRASSIPKSRKENPYIGELGAGSDFVPFMYYAGVPCIDVRYIFNKEEMNISNYPLYHTRYDTFYNVQRYIDPGFTYHKAMSQYLAILIRYLSDSLILPLSPTFYGKSLKRFYEDVIKNYEPTLKSNRICTDNFRAAISYFHDKMTVFQKRSLSNNQNYSAIQTRSLNDKLMLIERSLLDTNGLPNKPIYKHLILAPSKTDQYSGSGFPALNDLLYALNQSINSKVEPEILRFWVGDAISKMDPKECNNGSDHQNDLLSYTSSDDSYNFIVNSSGDPKSSSSEACEYSSTSKSTSDCKLSSFIVEAIKKHIAILAFTLRSSADMLDD
ncbi:unnamed protein product [Gordionus sp. m RMFG-2023]|uniref:N-acetylated-alpha-linked acidic dipeptidase 2-like n=1 Tax=Gordionus sp. m RMFG-2023 TaxID=3053472 RepID=UPI0030E36C8E